MRHVLSATAMVLAVGVAGCSLEAPSREATATAAEDACDDLTRDALDDVVGGQLAAFADDRWDDALGFASQAFRDDFDPAGLATLIEQEFPVAADASGHDLGPCVLDDDEAQVLVSVQATSGDRLALGYLLVLEDDGWRIAGAVPVGADEDTESGPLV